MARKDPIAHLGRHLEGPPQRLVDEVLALGPSGVVQLRTIVADRSRWDSDPLTVGNAALVLGLSRDPDSVPVLLEVLREADLDGLVHARALYGLERALSPELGRALLALEVSGERAQDVAWLLSGCRIRDDAVTERIRELIARRPGLGAEAAARYGDPALVPALDAAFDACLKNLEPITSFEGSELNSVHAALLALDGDNGRTKRVVLWLTALIGHLEHTTADQQRVLDGLASFLRPPGRV